MDIFTFSDIIIFVYKLFNRICNFKYNYTAVYVCGNIYTYIPYIKYITCNIKILYIVEPFSEPGILF